MEAADNQPLTPEQELEQLRQQLAQEKALREQESIRADAAEAVATPKVPHGGDADFKAPETKEEAAALAAEFAQFRKEFAAIRLELKQERERRTQRVEVAAVDETPEMRYEARLAAIAAQEQAGESYYCPGCGRLANYRQRCKGIVTAPHPPIEVVPTAELGQAPEYHTPAPNSDTPDLAARAVA